MVSFAVQKLLNLIRYHLFNFVFIFITLGGGSKKMCCNLCQKVLRLCFPLRLLYYPALHLGLQSTLSLFLCLVLAAAAKSRQLCPTLCDPIDGSPPGSAVPGILQARTLEWIAISFSSAWKWKVKVKSFSHVGLFTTPWTAAYQAPPSMGFSRQEYWSGVPLPSPVWY